MTSDEIFNTLLKEELAAHRCSPSTCQFSCMVESSMNRLKPVILRAVQLSREVCLKLASTCEESCGRCDGCAERAIRSLK